MRAWLGFLDESGFSQRPPVRATWAPKGQTPLLVEPFNWKRFSAIGALLTTPAGRACRWFMALHPGTIKSPQVIHFLKAWRRHARRKVILLWDGLPAHRSRLTSAALKQMRDWLTVEWLPGYAPELNPIELLWGYLDQTEFANTPLEGMPQLRRKTHKGLGRLRKHPEIGRRFLKHTGLF